jgi:hypothetical protein
MPSDLYLPDDPSYHEDLEAERHHQRYELALNRITVSDLLSEVDHLIAEEYDERKHPLHALAKHCLRHGTYRTSGQHAHLAEFLMAKFENLFDLAIERLVQEELANFGPWED